MLVLAAIAVAAEVALSGSAVSGSPQAQIEQVTSPVSSFEQIGSVGRSSDEELARLRERSALSQSLAEGSAAYDAATMPDPRMVALCEQAARIDMDPPEEIDCVAVLEMARRPQPSSIEEQLLAIIRPSSGAAPAGGQAVRGGFDANDVARRLSTGDVRSSSGTDAAGAIGQQAGTPPPRGN